MVIKLPRSRESTPVAVTPPSTTRAVDQSGSIMCPVRRPMCQFKRMKTGNRPLRSGRYHTMYGMFNRERLGLWAPNLSHWRPTPLLNT